MKSVRLAGNTRVNRKYLYARCSNRAVSVVCKTLLFDSIIESIVNHRAHA